MPTITIPSKKLSLKFPDTMDPAAIDEIIQRDVFGKPAKQAKAPEDTSLQQTLEGVTFPEEPDTVSPAEFLGNLAPPKGPSVEETVAAVPAFLPETLPTPSPAEFLKSLALRKEAPVAPLDTRLKERFDAGQEGVALQGPQEELTPIGDMVVPYQKLAAKSAEKLNRNMLSFASTLDDLATYISEVTGLPKGGAFEAAKKVYQQNSDYWEQRAGEVGLGTEIVAEFLGGAAPGMAQFMLGVPYAGARGYVEGGAPGAVREMASRAIMGQILHAANALTTIPRTLAMGAVGATEAIPTGDIREMAKSAGVMAGFGLTAGRGELTAREALQEAWRSRPSQRMSPMESPGTQPSEVQTSERIAEPSGESAILPTRPSSIISSLFSRLSSSLGRTGIGKPSEPTVAHQGVTVKQPTNDLGELYGMAREMELPLKDGLRQVTGQETILSRVKTPESTVRKLTKTGRQPGDLTDILGVAILTDNIQQIKDAVDKIRSNFKIIQDDNGFLTPKGMGYRGYHLDVELPNGLIAEVQLHTKKGWDLKEIVHKEIYEKLRTLESVAVSDEGTIAEVAAMHRRARQLFEDAYGTVEEGRVPWTGEAIPTPTPPVVDKTPGPSGKSTTVVHVGGEDPAVYRVIDLADIKSSHLPTAGFAKNSRYPDGLQERMYHSDPNEQLKVVQNGQRYNPSFVLTDNPDPVNGPPIVTKDGLVLGGNSRAMTLEWVYGNNPEAGAAYRDMLKAKAESFGIDPAEVDSLKHPILVRQLTDDLHNMPDLKSRIRSYNQTFLAGMSKAAEAVAKGAQVSRETLEAIGTMLAERDESIRGLLDTKDADRVINLLSKDGVIEKTQRARFVNPKTGLITEDGKDLIERTLLGRVLNDPDLLDMLPKSAVKLMERSLAPLAQLQARGEGWDISGDLKAALLEFSKFKRSDFKLLREYFAQRGAFGVEPSINDRARVILEALVQWKPVRFQKAMQDYAASAARDVKGQETIFGRPETPEQAFDSVFGELYEPERVAARKKGPLEGQIGLFGAAKPASDAELAKLPPRGKQAEIPEAPPPIRKHPSEMTERDLVDVKSFKVRDRFPKGSYRGELHAPDGSNIGGIFVVNGRAYVAEVSDTFVDKMLPGSFDLKAFTKYKWFQVSAAKGYQGWKFKKPGEPGAPPAPPEVNIKTASKNRLEEAGEGETPAWDLVSDDMVDIKGFDLAEHFQKGAYKGELFDQYGNRMGGVWVREGRAYIIATENREHRAIPRKMLPGTIPVESLRRMTGDMAETAEEMGVHYWRVKEAAEKPAEEKPAPAAKEPVSESTLRSAYETVRKSLGQTNVPIADVLDEAGVTMAEARPVLDQLGKDQMITLAETSWSIGEANVPKRIKDATIYQKTPGGREWRFSDIKFEPSGVAARERQEQSERARERSQWRAELDRMKAETTEAIETNLKAAAAADGIELRDQTGGEKTVYYVTKSTKEPGKWQATHLFDGVPQGDMTFDSKEDAIRSISGDWVPKAGPPIGDPDYRVTRTKTAGKVEEKPLPKPEPPKPDDPRLAVLDKAISDLKAGMEMAKSWKQDEHTENLIARDTAELEDLARVRDLYTRGEEIPTDLMRKYNLGYLKPVVRGESAAKAPAGPTADDIARLRVQFPDATDAQLQIMARDPDLKKQVARGSVAAEAAERAAAKRSSAQAGMQTQVDVFAGAKEAGTAPKGQTDLFGRPKEEREQGVLFSRQQPTAPAAPGAPPPIPYKPIPPGVRRSEIIKAIEKRISAPIRLGKIRTRKVAGLYRRDEKVIRVQKANDVETTVHETAHHVEELLGLPKIMPKEIRDLAYAGAQNTSREGFAEFFRLYTLHEAEARQKAPTFIPRFEQALKDVPELQDLIVVTREAWNAWQALPPVERVSSFIVKGKDTDKGRRLSFSEVYTAMKDALYPIMLARDLARKRGHVFEPSQDPYILARLTRGWARKAEQFLKYGTFQLDDIEGVKFTGKPLREILEPVERAGEMDLLDTYLVAKRAVNDERILKGFEGVLAPADFQKTVQELEPKYGEIAKELYKYSNELLDYLTNSGRISQELADYIRSKNAFYAPLYRVMDTEPTSSGLSSRKFGSLFNPIKRLTGSARNIYSPVESLLYNTYTMINAAERARVGEAMIRLSQMPEMGDVIERVPVPMKPVKMGLKEALKAIQKSIPEEGSDVAANFYDAIDSILNHQGFVKKILRLASNEKFMSEVGEEGLEEAIAKAGYSPEDIFLLNQVLTSFRPNLRTGPNEAIFYHKGEPILFELAPELAKAINNVDSGSLGALTKILSYPAKLLRAGATTFSPEFGLRNPARDQLTAFIQSKYGFIPGVDFVRGLYHMMGKSELWQKYNASGAAHAALVSLDRQYLSKNLKEIMQARGVKDAVRHPLELFQRFSEYTEEATRVGEFARALNKEGGDLNALLKAGLYGGREVSIDFGRIGGETARAINAMSAFWNARLEGIDRLARTMKEDPMGASLRAFLGVTLPSVLLWYHQKDDPYFQELPTWRRTLFWNIVTHNDDGSLKRVLSIPKPFEWGLLFGSVPEMALDWAYTQDPSGFKETAKQIVQTFQMLPIPTGVIPLAENWADKSWFFNRPIVPRDTEDLKPTLQYGPHTSHSARLAAEAMNKIPGLDQFASPAKIENLFLGYTAGAGRGFLEGVDKILSMTKAVSAPPDPSMTLADIPGIRAFVARFPSANTRSIEVFYDHYTQLKQEWESAKQIAGVRGTGAEVKMPEHLKSWEQTAQALSTLRKMAKQVFNDIPPNKDSMTAEEMQKYREDKREYLDNIYWGMVNVARAQLGKLPISKQGLKARE